jgi:hypothetical protein
MWSRRTKGSASDGGQPESHNCATALSKGQCHSNWKSSITQTYFLYRAYEPTNQIIQFFNVLEVQKMRLGGIAVGVNF